MVNNNAEARNSGIQMNATAQAATSTVRYMMPDGLLISEAEYKEWLESRRYR